MKNVDINSKRKSVISLSVLLCIVFSFPITLLAWNIQTLDSTGDVGWYSSIAIDSNNKVHISYRDETNQDLKYATNVSGSWVTSTLDSTGNVGTETSIVIDGSNKIHISYYDSTNGDLRYVEVVSGSYVISTVDSTGNVGRYSSIAIDINNKVYISYYDSTNGDLKYVTNTSGSWVTSTLDTTGDVGWYSSISIDSNNKIHISYYDFTNGDLKYATNASGSWVYTTLDSAGDVGYWTSIAIDSNNKVHISYRDETNQDLKYATNVSGSWVTSTLDSTGNVGTRTSIESDGSNKIHISYFDETNNDLKYVTNASGSWVTSTLDSTGIVGYYSSITKDSNNRIHISYQDYTNGDLKYAFSNVSPTLSWTGETNYASDGINPETGNTSTNFVYRIKYTDSDNDVPASSYPKIHIKKGGSEISGSPFTMTYVSGTYSGGAIYTYSKTLSTVGTDYTYYFEAQDVYNEVATGTPTNSIDAPDVSATSSSDSTTDTTVTPDKDAQITINSSNVGVKVEVLIGTFKETVKVTVSVPTSLPEVSQTGFKKSNIGVEIKLDKNIQPDKEIIITINYRKSDLTLLGLDESKLIVGYYDEIRKNWMKCSSIVYPEQSKIIGKTKHLSMFQILQLSSASDLSSVIAYPNPYKPNSGLGHTKITFKNLTSSATIRIFTITGELVHKYEETDGDGIYEWNVKNDNGEDIASGLYIYLVTNSNGEKAKGKIVIIK